ncbi:MAG: 1-deoxy-D-xylulose-5-phosphate reductoisomerase [Spirochaetales bacterium]|nr:1-deoxy-D-xylulose-5-phosphate reductoisomerase [Spirochaetales bacterium]
MKRVILLGCTGSIGTSTLDILKAYPEEYSLAGLSAHTSVKRLTELREEFGEIRCALSGIEEPVSGIDLWGQEGLLRLIRETEADVVVNGIAGSAGLLPSEAALVSGKDLALANKETIVMAGGVITELEKKTGKNIIPVDSEHSAVFHLLKNRPGEEVEELILTASGGPFRKTPKEALQSITPEEALRHPVWSMGRKITLDSATLANKGLEVLEAQGYFGFDLEKIKVLIHPEGKVHSLIRTIDGAMYAQISGPDMRLPILNALAYPALLPGSFGRMELTGHTLTFDTPDFDRFPMLPLAYRVGRIGGGYPAAYNCANEEAAAAFFAGKLSFTGIAEVVEETLEADWGNLVGSCEHAREIGFRAGEYAASIIKRRDG